MKKENPSDVVFGVRIPKGFISEHVTNNLRSKLLSIIHGKEGYEAIKALLAAEPDRTKIGRAEKIINQAAGKKFRLQHQANEWSNLIELRDLLSKAVAESHARKRPETVARPRRRVQGTLPDSAHSPQTSHGRLYNLPKRDGRDKDRNDD